MSKLDAQRAMKLARYERNEERARARQRSVAAGERDPCAGGSSGGRSGRAAGCRDVDGHLRPQVDERPACTREPGHSEKSHRYS